MSLEGLAFGVRVPWTSNSDGLGDRTLTVIRAGPDRSDHLPLKRELPKTHCTICGAAGYNMTVASGRCSKIINGERCYGTNQSAANVADWEECASCQATGFERNKMCSQCRGVGFLFVHQI